MWNVADAEIPGFDPANAPADNGLALATEASRRGEGFKDSQSAMTMTLFDGRGNQLVRNMRSKTLEMNNDGDRTLLFFENPADVRGTAFLTHSHDDGDDDQWLYLPALKRVKRIASGNRSGAFMSSEFSYEDLGNDEVGKYTYRYIGETLLNDIACYQLERTPKTTSGYTRHIVWLDIAELRAQRVDYYDRGNRLLKTLTTHDFQQYLDQYWRPSMMRMVNHQNGRSTQLQWRDYRFGVGLALRDFDRNAMRDIR